MSDNCSGGTIVRRRVEYAVLRPQMAPEELSRVFLEFVGRQYRRLRSQYRSYCKERHIHFDIDVLSETITRCAEKIYRDGIDAKTEYDMECYLFRSFTTNVRREGQYARNRNEDDHFSGDVESAYQRWYDENNVSHMKKVEKDLLEDFSVLYMLSRASDALPSQDVHLFKVKLFSPDTTYKKIQERTGMADASKRIRKVRQWLRDNVSKEEVMKAFYSEYGDILAD